MEVCKFASSIDGIQIVIEFIPSGYGFEFMSRRPKWAWDCGYNVAPVELAIIKEIIPGLLGTKKSLRILVSSENNGLGGPGFSKPQLPRQGCTGA